MNHVFRPFRESSRVAASVFAFAKGTAAAASACSSRTSSGSAAAHSLSSAPFLGLR